jgi:hypothetical protein
MSYYSKYISSPRKKVSEYSAMLQALVNGRVITQAQANKRFRAMLRRKQSTRSWLPKAIH